MAIQLLSNLNYPIGNIINQELQNANSAKMAVAFLKYSGVQVIKQALNNCLKNNGSIEIIAGLDFKTTDPQSMHYFIQLQKQTSNLKFYCYGDKEENKIKVGFEEKEVEYGQEEFNELILAYCCTVHKYQGSEAKCVIIPIHTQHYMMLKRNLIYTAVTRAKRLLIIIGTNKAMKIGLSNNSEQVRYTGLFKKK